MPGFRFLAKALGVSIPTVTRAAERLVQRGLLQSQGPRRALRVLAGPAADNPSPLPTTRGLLMLLEKPWAKLSPNTRAILEGCAEVAKGSGMLVHYVHMSYMGAVRQRRSWDRVLKAHPCSHLLVTMGSDVLVEWAKSRGLRVALMGGGTTHRDVPVFGVRLPELLETAIGKLRAKGHQRILFPAIGLAEMVSETIGRVAGKCMGMSAAELRREGLLIVEPEMDLDAAAARVIRGLAESRATAMVALAFRNYQLYTTSMMRAGIRIPGDVSTVMLIGDPEAAYIRPKPAHFEPPVELIKTRVRRWLLKGIRYQSGLGSDWLDKAWKEGETVVECGTAGQRETKG